MKTLIVISIIFLLLLIGLIIFFSRRKQRTKPSFDSPLQTLEALQEHSLEFEQQVINVTDGVYVAIGYGLANSIMIEGEDGVIIIDVMESVQAGEKVKAAFNSITDKPVKAIIYTHNHTDHIFGATAFADSTTDVYAQELMPYYLDRLVTVVRPIIEKRSYRMFGTYLQEDVLVNCGIGKKLMFDEGAELGVIRPNIVFKDSLEVNISGITLKMVHAPGETDDQLFIWLPDKKVLLCADNFYRSFPNLYTIRGTPHRDVNQWKESLDKMRYLQAEYLVPGHTKPIVGKDTIFKVLTDYRDAIQFVHDQTVRGMNMGMTPDELVSFVQLPDHLSQSPYLQEFYGTVEWSVRAIFDGYLGWFDGKPESLFPVSPEERAAKLAALAGGIENLEKEMNRALADEEYNWALEVAGYIKALAPENQAASEAGQMALTRLGESESNANARHYFLSRALEEKGLEYKTLVTPSIEMVHKTPMRAIFDALATRLNPGKTSGVHKLVVFQFPDSEEVFSVFVRKGIAEVQPFQLGEADIVITVKSRVWKEIAAEMRSPLESYLNGDIKISGGKIELIRFLSWFDRE